MGQEVKTLCNCPAPTCGGGVQSWHGGRRQVKMYIDLIHMNLSWLELKSRKTMINSLTFQRFLEVKLPYEPSCLLIVWLVGR